MLDERKAAILEEIVTHYVQTAQPVGSVHLARIPAIGVSAATVRNEMAALEHEGYLVQPHTSAGRIPTDKGYRFFVDRQQARSMLGPGEQLRVRDFFANSHGELEKMLSDTSQLLSQLTNLAAVVVGPAPETTTIRSVQLVDLSSRLALIVVVMSNGSVSKHRVELAEEASEEHLAMASTHLNGSLRGHSLSERVAVPAIGDAVADEIVVASLGALTSGGEASDRVFVGGASRMAEAFDAVDSVRSVLSILEQSFVVVTLLKDVLDRGLEVAIGAEHGYAPLAECAVVVAPYEAEGERLGSIGVLGPTRMNYPQALAAVAMVSTRLGRHLAEA